MERQENIHFELKTPIKIDVKGEANVPVTKILMGLPNYRNQAKLRKFITLLKHIDLSAFAGMKVEDIEKLQNMDRSNFKEEEEKLKEENPYRALQSKSNYPEIMDAFLDMAKDSFTIEGEELTEDILEKIYLNDYLEYDRMCTEFIEVFIGDSLLG